MRYYRVKTKDGVFYATTQDGAFYKLSNTPFDSAPALGEKIEEDKMTLLAPCQPTKIAAVGLNYRQHAVELGMELPKTPLLFLKPATTVIAPEADIIYPAMSEQVDYEAELGVVIKKVCKNITPKEADDYILGYTCLNDVTARDLQKKDGQWTRAKGFDTFCPIGPYIDTAFDPEGKRITATLNGEIKQDSTLDDLIFSVPELVAFISNVMTLNPGDVIATGTPSGIGPMQPGDRVEIAIEGLGTLMNTVK
ncbi:MAG: fumarylacetoacetate hydrolase family protein [Eubacteriales bacterium]